MGSHKNATQGHPYSTGRGPCASEIAKGRGSCASVTFEARWSYASATVQRRRSSTSAPLPAPRFFLLPCWGNTNIAHCQEKSLFLFSISHAVDRTGPRGCGGVLLASLLGPSTGRNVASAYRDLPPVVTWRPPLNVVLAPTRWPELCSQVSRTLHWP